MQIVACTWEKMQTLINNYFQFWFQEFNILKWIKKSIYNVFELLFIHLGSTTSC